MSREDLGGYRLVEPIGRGAASTVFVAEQGELGRRVAIKVLHPHLVGDGSERRMLAEADVLSRLDHPGIVKVLDMGVAPDGRAYVVMEHLVGEPLHVRMRRERLTEERVVAFARQLASALEAAHGAGVVHRDLKPENVFVVEDPELPGGERVKLLDFGIAKREGQEQTATGIVLGTPAYMAPEQFRGSRHVDPRADIYSLGVVLYVMATGTPLFAGQSTGELLAAHEFCAPARASTISDVSSELSAVIERCVAKRPEDRFATMGELDGALCALEAAAASPCDDDPTEVWGELEEATTGLVPWPAMFGADPISCLIRVAPVTPVEPVEPVAPMAPVARVMAEPPVEPMAPVALPRHRPVHAAVPPTAPIVRRSTPWPVAVIAGVAAAGVVIALVRGLRPVAAAKIGAAAAEVPGAAADLLGTRTNDLSPCAAMLRDGPAPAARPAGGLYLTRGWRWSRAAALCQSRAP